MVLAARAGDVAFDDAAVGANLGANGVAEFRQQRHCLTDVAIRVVVAPEIIVFVRDRAAKLCRCDGVINGS